MKKLAIATGLGFLMACGSSPGTSGKSTDLEKEYAQHFDQEYNTFLQSDRWKKFQEVYARVGEMAHQAQYKRLLELDSAHVLPGKLCFIADRKGQASYQRAKKEEEEGKTFFFNDYEDFSGDVNAVMVGSEFEKKEYRLSVGGEHHLHAAEKMGRDRKAFEEDHQFSKKDLYRNFCENLMTMNEAAHYKYVLVLKLLRETTPKIVYDNRGSGLFEPGVKEAVIYLFDLSDGQLIKMVPVLAFNSENIRVYNEGSGKEEMKKDLEQNYRKEVHKALKENFDITGTVPM